MNVSGHPPRSDRPDAPGAWLGLAAAALFGASTPVAKLLVPGSGPLALAGLLYLGAGLGLAAAAPLRRRDAEAPLQRSDVPVLAGVIVSGGVVGPVLLVLGLARLSGTAASLLLNLEAPFTIALAVLVLGERLSRREAGGAVAVILGAAAMTWAPGRPSVDVAGVACVAGACAVGAARQAAYFATAPFIGAITAVLLLRERPSVVQLAAAAVMATGVVLIVLARHAHRHVHEVIEHEHAHVHDVHHAHVHEGPVIEPHSHVHRHARLAHDHPHLPDVHHRHDH